MNIYTDPFTDTMSHINLRGMGVALITPFKKDKSVDYQALARLLDYQIKNGVDYLVVLGTTAETPALSPEERRDIKQFVEIGRASCRERVSSPV